MSEISVEYKGETIRFYESTDEWHWKSYTNVSLKKVKAAIDAISKEMFKSVTAYNYNYKLVNVTSQTEDGAYWIKDANGKREKITRLFADTLENTETISRIQQLKEQQDALASEINKARELLVQFQPPIPAAREE